MPSSNVVTPQEGKVQKCFIFTTSMALLMDMTYSIGIQVILKYSIQTAIEKHAKYVLHLKNNVAFANGHKMKQGMLLLYIGQGIIVIEF